jgi:pimeloyl-ACP methyl ester carboxylesterase
MRQMLFPFLFASMAFSCSGRKAIVPKPSPAGGSLELWLSGVEAGIARYSDDGDTLKSEVRFKSPSLITVSRATRKARFAAGGKDVEIDIASDGLPWGNGHAALARLALEWFPAASAKPMKLVSPGMSLDSILTVSSASGGANRVEIVPRQGSKLIVDIDAKGRVTYATTGGSGKAAFEVKAPPEGIEEEFIEVERAGIALRGVIWRPEGAKERLPLLIVVAGSGPTDRDCNQAGAMSTNAFRMLAEGLARKGIATLRFDKRFSGQTAPIGRAWSLDDQRRLRIHDYADDLGAFVARSRSDKRFGPITVLGHSEGGLVSILAASKTPPDGLIFLNSLGRPFSKTIREQLSAKVDAKMLGDFDELLRSLRESKPYQVAGWLRASGLVSADTVEFFRSEMDLAPGELLAALKIPALVLQGETDMQTTADDAKALASRRKDVKVKTLAKTNHVLKEVPTRTRDVTSYRDPSLPLAPGVVDAVAEGVKR